MKAPKSRIAYWFSLSVVVLSLIVTALAHSGRTDGRGGHTNHSTGEYHYHHGYPEHQHIGGACPYKYDDKTSSSSGSNSSSKKESTSSGKVNSDNIDAGKDTSQKEKAKKEEKNWFSKIMSVAGDVFMWFVFGSAGIGVILAVAGWLVEVIKDWFSNK